MRARFAELGYAVSDRVSWFVGTWRFVGIYTATMIAWILLHTAGVLHFDSPDFMRWNLWLSYFAGTQASIVLMSSARQAALERRKLEANFQVDKETHAMTQESLLTLHELGQILEDLLDEGDEK